MKSVIKNGPIVVKEPGNYDARAEIMWAGSTAYMPSIAFTTHIQHE